MSLNEYWDTFKYHLDQIEECISSVDRSAVGTPIELLDFVKEIEFQLSSIEELADAWQGPTEE